MNDVAIQIENLGKKYRIGSRGVKYKTLRDTLTSAALSPIRRLRGTNAYRSNSNIRQPKSENDQPDAFWALKDISCSVMRGEVVGIIGHNGAGKSTFLKILSRVAEPTTGSVDIYGRVGSLLEVGTGFHPELTGRENIFLNGAILGMKRAEIERKFDAIVAFAETEKFVDTPVKHYSSGMYLRLAFAVAAHLEPEILLVDEVLAVGDAAFQRKCLGKMGEVAKEGRTVILVSHNMGAITQLCGRALWIHGGKLEKSGNSAEVVSSYLTSGESHRPVWHRGGNELFGNEVQIKSARVIVSENEPGGVVDFKEPFKVEIGYTITEAVRDLSILCRIIDPQGNIIWTSWDTDTTNLAGMIREPGKYLSTCAVPGCLLRPGLYSLSIGALIRNIKVLEHHENVLSFEVSQVGYHYNLDRLGILTPALKWQVKCLNGAKDSFEHGAR